MENIGPSIFHEFLLIFSHTYFLTIDYRGQFAYKYFRRFNVKTFRGSIWEGYQKRGKVSRNVR